jgi:4-hydroxybenzoate polyprenyltransferase
MKSYLSLVKFSHTIFALPFALTGWALGTLHTEQPMSWKILGLVLVCMVTARSAAMAFNRWLDKDIDAANPRTRIREIPSGIISAQSAMMFTIINAVLFVLATWFINKLCFFLSPVALLVILGYSYTKRFTWLCHFVLGIGLGLAPVGAYLAVTGVFHVWPVLLGWVVFTWVAGFDIIYALQDEEFDKLQALHSIPVLLGTRGALWLSVAVHTVTALLLVWLCWQMQIYQPEAGYLLTGATAMFILLLIYQHTLVTPSDLSKVNIAFFTTNGIGSLMFGLAAVADLLVF